MSVHVAGESNTFHVKAFQVRSSGHHQHLCLKGPFSLAKRSHVVITETMNQEGHSIQRNRKFHHWIGEAVLSENRPRGH